MILHLVTDRGRLAESANLAVALRCLLQQARHAVEAGVDVLQVRERDLDARTLEALVGELVRMTRGSRTRVVVNDRVDIALAAGADGVHLPADAPAPALVRGMVARAFLIGRSVRTPADAVSAAGADYLIAGTLWPSLSKSVDHPLLGTGGLKEIVGAVAMPVIGIGGVTLERIADVAATGAAGVAAIGMFVGARSASGCRAVPLADLVNRAREQFDTPRSSP